MGPLYQGLMVTTSDREGSTCAERRTWAIPSGRMLLAGSLLLSALLIALALNAGPRFRLLPWVGLLPLFMAIRACAPREALLAGALWGAALFALLSGDGGAVPRTVESFALLAAMPALYAWVCAGLTGRFGFNPLILGLGWVGVECAFQPLGLHNGLLAGTLGDGTFVQVVGGLLGYAFVAFLVAFSNALILSLVSDVGRRISGLRYVPRASLRRRRLLPQTCTAPGLMTLGPSQPRAPPA